MSTIDPFKKNIEEEQSLEEDLDSDIGKKGGVNSDFSEVTFENEVIYDFSN